MSARLAVYHCRAHGLYALAVEHPSRGGLRLTSTKCCGRWTVVADWPMTQEMLDEMAGELARAAELSGRAGEKGNG